MFSNSKDVEKLLTVWVNVSHSDNNAKIPTFTKALCWKKTKKKEKHGFRKNTELEKKRSSQFSKEIFSRILQCRLQKGAESWIILNKHTFDVLLLVRKKCILALNQKPVQVKRNINGTEFWKISDKMIVAYYMRPISFTSFKNGPFLDLSG